MRKGLLASQIGYDLGDPKRAIVRRQNPGKGYGGIRDTERDMLFLRTGATGLDVGYNSPRQSAKARAQVRDIDAGGYQMKRICVIGSLNIDMIAKGPALPRMGETVFTDSFDLFVGGGKGANQAVAAGKLGADVMMAGMLGDHFFGLEYLDVLRKHGVSCEALEVLPGEYPGIAYVAVDGNGDNMLFVYSGTNMRVLPPFVDRHWESLSCRDIFLFQQEIPMKTNLYAMERLSALGGKTIILDPAPATGFADAFLAYVDILTPNDVELESISEVSVEHGNRQSYRRACLALHSRGARRIIAKAGRDGAYLSDGDTFQHIPAFEVNAVDTTAAGDSFNAGLAYGLSIGKTIEDSIILAHGVAGLSTTAVGAQNAMPGLEELKRFLKGRQFGSILE